MSKLACLFVVIAAVGCGGDDGGGGGGGTGIATMAQAQELCETLCGHEDECGTLGQTLDECVMTCTTEGLGGVRADVVADYEACIPSVECTMDVDSCVSCEPTSAHEQYETACRAKAAECGADPGDIDGACETSFTSVETEVGILCVYAPEIMDALRACFDMDCAMIGDCFTDVQMQYGLEL